MNFNAKDFRESLKGVMRRTSLPFPVRLDHPIEGAREDAEVLLAFAVQSRRNLKDELVDKMSKAEEALRAADKEGRLANADERAAFWKAYDELAVAMAPLSAYSIRSSMMINAKRLPGSIVTPPALLAMAAVAVFLFCMIAQSFWVAGKGLLENADAVEAERVQLVKKRATNFQAMNVAEIKYRQLMNQLEDRWAPIALSGVTSGKGSSLLTDTERAQLKTQGGVLLADLFEKDSMVRQQDRELEEAEKSVRPLQVLLKNWRGSAHSACTGTIPFLCLVTGNDDRRFVGGRGEEAFWPATLPAASAEIKAVDVGQDGSDGRKQAEADMQRKTTHEVRIILGNLATYIIPAGMGLLGALAFLLQSMATQLREYTYTPISVSSTFMRLCLGAIAGVFGGLAGPGSDAMLRGMPPLFIPFVFGYGIEILFSLLDRVVQTFTQTEAPKARPL